MNIGQAARATGISAKMIRYYESIGLIPAAFRTDAGYRVYTENEIRTLQFIRRARGLGFSVEQIQRLLGLWRDTTRSSADVKSVALAHVQELEAKVEDMLAMIKALRRLADSCHGDEQPDCAILDDLVAGEPATGRKLGPSRFDGVATLSRTMKRRTRARESMGPRPN